MKKDISHVLLVRNGLLIIRIKGCFKIAIGAMTIYITLIGKEW